MLFLPQDTGGQQDAASQNRSGQLSYDSSDPNSDYSCGQPLCNEIATYAVPSAQAAVDDSRRAWTSRDSIKFRPIALVCWHCSRHRFKEMSYHRNCANAVQIPCNK